MKDLKISNELISEVLECNCTDSKIISNELSYEAFGVSYINIYEFAHKCKEWAYQNNYDIWSITWGTVEFQNNIKNKGTKRIDADTEIEAIVKACNWILEQNK